jgi:hypothetical protein
MTTRIKTLLTAIILFIAILLIYSATGPNYKTYYDYFVRLAEAILRGRLYLTENPPWLNELVPINGKYYVVYPPMPTILLLPFVAIWGMQLNQTLFTQIIGSLNAVLVYYLFLKLKFNQSKAILLGLILTLGTNHWYLASVGSAWYLALIIGAFFTLLSLLELFGKKRFFLIGLLIGAAYWSRLPTILAVTFPLLYILFIDKKNVVKSVITLFLGVLVFVLLNAGYNYLRFGTILDVGYIKIPGILNETDFKYGLLSPMNIPKQLKVMFLKMPLISPKFPYLYPSWYGMAIWLTTPAFFLVLKARWKDRLALITLITVLIMSLPSLTHATVGFTQFGYRYAMDFTPFLLLLTGLGLQKTNKVVTYSLIALSMVINLWGVLWINKFGWVGW